MASAAQVGSYFVSQYYLVLQRQPETVHHFYKNTSSMVRVDGDTTVTADTILKIHTVITSLNFIVTEIETINSLPSWGGGITVLVSGHVMMRDYNGRRKFMQSFFLAPQERGFFVLSDIFHFLEEFAPQDHAAPQSLDNRAESLQELSSSPSPPEAQVSDYEFDEEAIDYVQSLHFGDGDGFEEQQSVVAESPEVHEGEHQNDVINDVNEGEPQKKTYASILRVSKGQPATSTSSQPLVNQSAPLASGSDSKPQPVVQQLQVESPLVPKTNEAAEDYSGRDNNGELKSVYVRNLPPSVTSARLEQDFKQFGTIKEDGIIIKNRPDVGVCYAFVEYESTAAVHAAIQGSPIELDGRQIYVEKRRANASRVGSELKSVYVRNLPPSVTAARLEQDFKQFGTIKEDGIIIRSRPDVGICYAFVEYESMAAVHAAIQGSPIELDGRRIYIEKRRANASGGGRRDRDDGQRGGHSGGRGSGRGSSEDGSDYNRQKSNAYHPRRDYY